MIWFTSDWHLGHEAVLRYSNRPFGSVAEMNDALIVAWNAVVHPQDTVYFLGDFAFANDRAQLAEWFGALEGTKRLIAGNHDGKRVLQLPWASVEQLITLKVSVDDQKHRLVLCHYPLMTWPQAHQGVMHLHGHSHGNLARRARVMDVGVDAQRTVPFGTPLSVDEIVGRLRAEQYVPVDHHVPGDSA